MHTTAAEWLTAFGTVGAAVAAVGIALHTELRERRQRPSLWVDFNPALEGDYMTGVDLDSRTESHWLRLRVGNEPKKRSAEDVEVFIMQFFLVDPKPVRLINVTGLPLRWSNLFEQSEPVTRATVPPGMPRYLDLLALTAPDVHYAGAAQEGEPAAASLQLYPVPSGQRHCIGAGKYELWLAVTARDTDSAMYVLEVTFDGKWWAADSIREHLLVSKPKRQPLSTTRRARWLQRFKRG